jgi:HEAT repeat protein
MRRQDELIAIYEGKPPLARKFLLSQMEGLSLAFDSEELLYFLLAQLDDTDPVIRVQALYSIVQFLPGYTRKRYALESQAHGHWTTYGRDVRQMTGLASTELAKAARTPQVGEATLMAAEPLVQAIVGGLDAMDGWDRTRAIVALGNLPLRASQDWLSSTMRTSMPDLEVGLALAEHERPESTQAILTTVRLLGPGNPDLYLLLGSCSGDEAIAIAMDAIPRTTARGRMNIARAIARFPPPVALEAFVKLAKHHETWVDVMGLASLEDLADPACLPTIAEIYRSARHRFFKVQAVKAAGAFRNQWAVNFCTEALGEEDHSISAMALESLVRLRTPPEVLRAVAIPFLESEHLKARVNAILAALSPDEALESAILQELLLSPDPLPRIEAACCLGYLQSPGALDLLATLAGMDPSIEVGCQAVKAMSRYPAGDALPRLMPLVGKCDEQLALTIARVVGRYEGGDAELAGGALAATLAEPMAPPVRAALLRALGTAVRRSGRAAGSGPLIAGLDDPEPQVQAGALEGLVLAGAGGDTGVTSRLTELSAGREPHTAARALLALWFSGDVEAAGRIGSLLATEDTKATGPVVECTLEIGLLVTDIASGQRFPELADRLAESVETSEYRSFVEREGLAFKPSEKKPFLGEEEPEPVQAPVSRAPPGAPAAPVAPAPAPPPPPPRALAPLPQRATATRIAVSQLANFLSQTAVRKVDSAAALKRHMTREAELLSDAPTGLQRFLALWALPWVKPLVAAGALLLVVLVAVLVQRPPAGPPIPSGLPGYLWVYRAEGSCRTDDGSLRIATLLEGGAVIRTLKDGELVLMTPWDSRLTLGPDSSCTFESVRTGASGQAVYRFREPRGDVLFETTRKSDLELVFADTVVTATSTASLHVTKKPREPRTLTVVKGEARVRGRDRASGRDRSTSLEASQSVQLP